MKNEEINHDELEQSLIYASINLFVIFTIVTFVMVVLRKTILPI